MIRAMPVPDYTLDFDRLRRVGFPEVVLAAGKSTPQIVEICRQLARAHDVLVTRLSPEVWEEIAASPLPGRADYDPRSGTLHLSVGKPMARVEGTVSIVTAGTADTVVAEEARRTLEYLGVSSRSCRTSASRASCGSSRASKRSSRPTSSSPSPAWRPPSSPSSAASSAGPSSPCQPRTATALPSVVLRRFFRAAISCANGVTAVNIDSGYAAAMAAYRILSGGPHRWDRKARRARTAREYIHAAAIGVDRKRKKALLSRPTTPVKVTRGTTVSQLLDAYRNASFQARALGKCAGGVRGDAARPAAADDLPRTRGLAHRRRDAPGDRRSRSRRTWSTSSSRRARSSRRTSTRSAAAATTTATSNADDKELRDLYIDRLYDTFIDEEKYWATDLAVSRFADTLARRQNLSSRAFLALLAEKASKDKGSILGACARNGACRSSSRP